MFIIDPDIFLCSILIDLDFHLLNRRAQELLNPERHGGLPGQPREQPFTFMRVATPTFSYP